MITLRHKIDDLAREFTTTHTTATPIQVLWDTFASAIQNIIKDQIPSKWSSSLPSNAFPVDKEGFEEVPSNQMPQIPSSHEETAESSTR